MTIRVKDLGLWERYDGPAEKPAGLPEGVQWCRRVSDGADWYEFARNPASWQADSLKATALPTAEGDRVQAVYREPHSLFPQNCRLIEITGYPAEIEKPHRDFEQRIVDLATSTFNDPPAPRVLSVSKAQGKVALLRAGLLNSVKAIIAQADEETQLWWDDANTWDRTSKYISQMGALLSLSEAQIDKLFLDASKILT
jgi:hypothetical protein